MKGPRGVCVFVLSVVLGERNGRARGNLRVISAIEDEKTVQLDD